MIVLTRSYTKPVAESDLEAAVAVLPPSLNLKPKGRCCFTTIFRLDLFVPDGEPNMLKLVGDDIVAGPSVFAIVDSRLRSIGYVAAGNIQ